MNAILLIMIRTETYVFMKSESRHALLPIPSVPLSGTITFFIISPPVRADYGLAIRNISSTLMKGLLFRRTPLLIMPPIPKIPGIMSGSILMVRRFPNCSRMPESMGIALFSFQMPIPIRWVQSCRIFWCITPGNYIASGKYMNFLIV